MEETVEIKVERLDFEGRKGERSIGGQVLSWRRRKEKGLKVQQDQLGHWGGSVGQVSNS